MQAPGANQNCARSLGGNGGLDTSGKIGKSFVWVVRVWDERVPRHRPLQPSPLPTTPPPRIAAPPHPSHRDVKYNCTQKTTSTCSFAFCNTSRRRGKPSWYKGKRTSLDRRSGLHMSQLKITGALERTWGPPRKSVE